MSKQKMLLNNLKKGGENMKRNMTIAIVAALFMVLAGATSSFALVKNGPHDLTAAGSGPVPVSGVTEICKVCHTPHNGAAATYLWNRGTPSVTLTFYTSPNVQATSGVGVNSAKCLSCHDGATSLDAFGGGAAGFSSMAQVGGVTVGNLGGDALSMQNDHPIGFNYNTAVTGDAESALHTTAVSMAVNAVQVKLTADPELGCPTCHDLHGSALTKLLRISNAASALCLTCHIK